MINNDFCKRFLAFVYCIVHGELLGFFQNARAGKFAIYKCLFAPPDRNQCRLLITLDILDGTQVIANFH